VAREAKLGLTAGLAGRPARVGVAGLNSLDGSGRSLASVARFLVQAMVMQSRTAVVRDGATDEPAMWDL
jgi:hypothetical protein